MSGDTLPEQYLNRKVMLGFPTVVPTKDGVAYLSTYGKILADRGDFIEFQEEGSPTPMLFHKSAIRAIVPHSDLALPSPLHM